MPMMPTAIMAFLSEGPSALVMAMASTSPPKTIKRGRESSHRPRPRGAVRVSDMARMTVGLPGRIAAPTWPALVVGGTEGGADGALAAIVDPRIEVGVGHVDEQV